MHLAYYVPVLTGYLAFAILSERLWPFTPPRGWVAERRFRKGRIIGLFVGAVTLTGLATLLPDPDTALAFATAGACTALLALIRFRPFLKPAFSHQASTGVPTAPAATRTAAAPDPRVQAGLDFLKAHRPDIVLDGTETGREPPLPDFTGREWTSRTKFEAVVATCELDEEQRRRFCSEHGLERDALSEWRSACVSANERAQRASERERTLAHDYEARIRTLQAELARKDRALAETATSLMLHERSVEQAS